MLPQRGAWRVGCAAVIAGLIMSCKPAPEPLTWKTVEGPQGLFTTALPVAWGDLLEQSSEDLLAFATEAADGTQHNPQLLQRRAMQEQAGLLITFDRVWPDRVSDEAWIGYVGRRATIEVRTHNQLTDRALIEHVRDGRVVSLVVRHSSFGSRAYHEVVHMEERRGIVMTTRLFVPQAVYLAHGEQIEAKVASLEWSEKVAHELLPPVREAVPVLVPSI